MAVFFAGCPSSPSSLTDEEKAVLVNKAITGAGTTSSSASPARGITGGTLSASIGTAADMTGSAFAGEVKNTDWIVFVITYANVSVTVQDDNGDNVTVILNGSMKYAYNVSSSTYIFYGTVSGTVDGESYSFDMDLKTVMTVSGSTYTFTITGTAGGETVNETYTGTAP